MQAGAGHHTGHHIIDHDTKTAVHALIEPADRPGFDNIEKPESEKTRHYPGPFHRQCPQGNPQTDKLVPDYTPMIVDTQLATGLTTKLDPQRECHHNQHAVLPHGQWCH